MARRARIAASLGSHIACAALGLAAGFALFGLDDFERARLWIEDRMPQEADAGSRAISFSKIDENIVGGPSWRRDEPLGALPAPVRADADAAWNIPFWIDARTLPAGMAKARAIALVTQAAAAWAPCGARFAYQGERAKPDYGSYGPEEEPTRYDPIVSWMQLEDGRSGLALLSLDEDSGQVTRWSMELDLESTQDAAALLSTATHEFGHLLGMEHGRDAKSIMFGGPNPAVLRPSAADLRECSRSLSSWSTELAEAMAHRAEPPARPKPSVSATR